MKQTPRMQKIQENMRPGIITLAGFLGSDTRNLADILIDDEAAVRRAGRTHADIAARMMELRDMGTAGLGEFVFIDPHFDVRVESVRGKLPCPFGDPGIFAKINVTVRNTAKKKEITYTDLHIHMVQSHGFYEGRGSLFRLDPMELIDILEVEPESGA